MYRTSYLVGDSVMSLVIASFDNNFENLISNYSLELINLHNIDLDNEIPITSVLTSSGIKSIDGKQLQYLERIQPKVVKVALKPDEMKVKIDKLIKICKDKIKKIGDKMKQIKESFKNKK